MESQTFYLLRIVVLVLGGAARTLSILQTIGPALDIYTYSGIRIYLLDIQRYA